MLPITTLFALPLSLYYCFLQVRVSLQRISTQVSLAPSSLPAPTTKDKEDDKKHQQHDPLLAAFRTQANFAENVPLALILAGLVEANGGSKVVLSTLLGGLVVARFMHGEMGLMVPGSGGIGRPVGFFGTLGVIGGLAVYGAWLAVSGRD